VFRRFICSLAEATGCVDQNPYSLLILNKEKYTKVNVPVEPDYGMSSRSKEGRSGGFYTRS